MECTEISELLSEYIDDVLDPETKSRVDKHLLSCKNCSEELASMRALVDELASLESVEAPKDFLNQLDQRMEPDFSFRKLVRTLFVPMHVKIPLQLATGAAMAILILAIWSGPQPQERIADVSEEPPSVMLAKETPADHLDAHGFRSSLQNASSKPSRKAGETVELALLVQPKADARRYARQEAGEASPARPEIMAEIGEKKAPSTSRQKEREATRMVTKGETTTKELREETQAAGLPEEGRLPSRDEADVSLSRVNEVLSEVKDLIGLLEGIVLSVEYEEQTQRPQSISAAIPVENYPIFTEKLGRLAVLRTPPTDYPQKDHEVVPVRIRFVTSE